MIEILKSDLSAPLNVTFNALEAGMDSDVIPFALRNPGTEDLVDLLLVIQVESLTSPGLYVSTGLPPQDELWARARVIGQGATGWTPIGAFAALLVPSLPAGAIRYGEIKMRPPSTATAVTYRWVLSVIEAEHSRALPPALAAAAPGILPHVGDRGASLLLQGFEATSSSTPDDQVHVAGGAGIVRGELVTLLAADVALDQLDSAAEALALGEAYWATLSLTSLPSLPSLGSLTLTKGLKALSPSPPAAPAGEALIEQILVRYQTGSSVIAPEDVAGRLTYGRYLATPGDGLQVIVHAGQAVAGGTWRYHSARQALALEASATSYLWQLASGELALTQTPEPPTPADTTALGPLWEIDTDVAAVTELRDLRTYTRGPVVLHLVGGLPGAPGEIDSLLVHQALSVEIIVYRLSDNGAGTAGQTVLDLEINGATVYTSQATDDQRPAWPYDAAGPDELVDGDGIHELVALRRGDVVTLKSAEHPTGGAPSWAEAYLICWPR